MIENIVVVITLALFLCKLYRYAAIIIIVRSIIFSWQLVFYILHLDEQKELELQRQEENRRRNTQKIILR